jgi:hypothetical protein
MSTKTIIMKSKLFKLITTIFAAMALTVSACNKNYDKQNFPDPITQNFSMQIGTETTSISKGWTKETWVFNYNQTPTVLTLTGTGSSVGRNYTKTCTVADLKAGTVSLTILPGNYNATFTTQHTRTTDIFSMNGLAPSNIHSDISDVLDIKIDNDLYCTGTPLTLTATLDDYLIIYDVPTETSVQVYDNGYFAGSTDGDAPRLLNTFYSTNKFHYAYMNAKTNYKAFPSNKALDGTGFVKGNAYHIISNFQASTVLNIPDMINIEIVQP